MLLLVQSQFACGVRVLCRHWFRTIFVILANHCVCDRKNRAFLEILYADFH